jgi:hypothetical protein
MSEHTITFQPFEQARKPRGKQYSPKYRLEFAIEPPVEVHDPEMIDQRIYYPLSTVFSFWGKPPAKNVRLTHSDEEATYGTLIPWYPYVNGEEPRSVLEEFIKERFEEALNPLGRTTLHFVFEPQEQADRARIA